MWITTALGGEPHQQSPAARLRNGLPRLSLKGRIRRRLPLDVARSYVRSTSVSVEYALVQGRRVYPSPEAGDGIRRRKTREPSSTECNAPSAWVGYLLFAFSYSGASPYQSIRPFAPSPIRRFAPPYHLDSTSDAMCRAQSQYRRGISARSCVLPFSRSRAAVAVTIAADPIIQRGRRAGGGGKIRRLPSKESWRNHQSFEKQSFSQKEIDRQKAARQTG
jgi:hypothetical protein